MFAGGLARDVIEEEEDFEWEEEGLTIPESEATLSEHATGNFKCSFLGQIQSIRKYGNEKINAMA